MRKRAKREFTEEFRKSAVDLVISSEKSTAAIAKDLGISATTLYSWVNKGKIPFNPKNGQNNSELYEELKRLKKELSEVKEQRDILKKATAYFAKESL